MEQKDKAFAQRMSGDPFDFKVKGKGGEEIPIVKKHEKEEEESEEPQKE